MRALLTNDDGYQSHALVPTLELLQSVGLCVEVVVPDGQRSGYSKATTRRGEIEITQREVGGHKVTTLSGTPADCVNYGVFEHQPDIVISGANLGSNLDIGHFYSSGTIGAALEAILLGTPAIAISLCYTSWGFSADEITRALRCTEPLIKEFIRQRPSMGMSVNVPLEQQSSKFFPATLGEIKITQLFQREGDRLTMRRQQWNYSADECELGTDRWAVAQGIPSVTPLDSQGLPLPPETIRPWLEQRGLLHSLTV